jgi:hypothetical protein
MVGRKQISPLDFGFHLPTAGRFELWTLKFDILSPN